MKIKSSLLWGFLISNVHASQITIDTRVQLDLENSYAAGYLQAYGPMKLELAVVDMSDPSNPPLWTWETANLGFRGEEMKYNQTLTTIVDAPQLPPMQMGQLTFSLKLLALGVIPMTISGKYMSGTLNSLTSIDFLLNLKNTTEVKGWAMSHAKIVGNRDELPEPKYQMTTINTSFITPLSFQTFPVLSNLSTPANSMYIADSAKYIAEKTPTAGETTLTETPSNNIQNNRQNITYPFEAKVTFPKKTAFKFSPFWMYNIQVDVSKIPVTLTVFDPNNPSTALFQTVINLGLSSNGRQFIFGETLTHTSSLDNPLPAIQNGNLQASLFGGKVISTFGGGTNKPLTGIGFTWTDQFLPVVYPIIEGENPDNLIYTAVNLNPTNIKSPLQLQTLVAEKLPNMRTSKELIKETTDNNVQAIINAINPNQMEMKEKPTITYRRGFMFYNATFDEMRAISRPIISEDEESTTDDDSSSFDNPYQVRDTTDESDSETSKEKLDLEIVDLLPPVQNPAPTMLQGLYSWLGNLKQTAENWLDDPEPNNQ